ncbi:MAG: sensor histidine kinase [Verrucomicrobia bacterium]|nr:MAG: sensor histidine kinase [Verrucomicrobiota bacterium]
MRFPLLARIALMLVLNLALVAALVAAFFHFEFQLGLDSLLLSQTEERLRAVRQVLAARLSETSPAEWDEVLREYSEAYRVRFTLWSENGRRQLAGEPLALPLEVRRRMLTMGPLESGFPGRPRRWRLGLGRAGGAGQAAGGIETPATGRTNRPPAESPSRQTGDGPGLRRLAPRTGAGPMGPGRLPPGPPRFVVRLGNPVTYWVGMRIPVGFRTLDGRPAPPRELILLTKADARRVTLFADPVPWLLLGAAIALVSILFWVPVVRGITRALRRMAGAAERIAEGDLEVRVPVRRSDELGQLATVINRMTGRLAGYVEGQRRFLGDVAHELGSPLARAELALEMLRHEADPRLQDRIDDLHEEIRHMSGLVQELLSYARASLGEKAVRLQPVRLLPLAGEVVRRENHAGADVRVQIDPDCRVLAEPELLRRSLANLVRNAIRYAASAGPITVSADRQEQGVVIVVGDRGPGIPEEHLDRVFDPFYRLEAARDRDTGGVGLGLTIVKTCVEAMGGRVRCRNRRPSGLEVAICLPPAEEEASSEEHPDQVGARQPAAGEPSPPREIAPAGRPSGNGGPPGAT